MRKALNAVRRDSVGRIDDELAQLAAEESWLPPAYVRMKQQRILDRFAVLYERRVLPRADFIARKKRVLALGQRGP